MIDRRLTLKQEQFAREYVDNGGNGAQAALVAYNTEDPDSAKAIASKNLSLANVQTAVISLKAELKEGCEEGLKRSIALAREMQESTDPRKKEFAMRFLLDACKFALPIADAPKETKHLHINLPKR